MRALALVSACADVAGPGVNAQDRRLEFDFLPAINQPRKVFGGKIGRRWHRGRPMTLNADAVLDPRCLGLRLEMQFGISPDRIGGDIGEVRQVHEVVDNQLPVSVHRIMRAAPCPFCVVVIAVSRYFRRIGKRRIAHPYP